MDERRFRAALDTITATIEGYGEDTVVAALRTVLDRFGYEVVQRDFGPACCAYGEYYEAEGTMPPIHECPSERPDAWVADLAPPARHAVESLLIGRRRL
jgi:hypothetical protein